MSETIRLYYSRQKRLLYTFGMIALGVVVAGFWNYHLVDGFGRDFVAGQALGDTAALAGSFGEKGSGFGFLFAAIAGLAATFTACNCVAFAMLPGLACSTDGRASRRTALKSLVAFVVPVVGIGAVYGIFIGLLGPEGIEAFNQRAVRMAQAQSVFTLIGVVMLGWGAVEMGFARRWTESISDEWSILFSRPSTRAAMLGVLVGAFAVGRPFPVFREFLTYAATAQSPLYGAGVMMVHGLGQILVMLLLFLLLVWLAGDRLIRWSQRAPHQAELMTGMALIAGGSYFVFYWGLAFLYDIGRWGFKLGWYGG
ncbi:MAG: hypothetical protein WD115_04505 [Balneolaceae bacterium]